MVNCQINPGRTIIILMPNQSANRYQTLLLFCLVAGVTLSVALFWLLQGVWLVLPFAGLEIMVLAYVMARVSRATYQKQVITINQQWITVEEGETHPVRRWQFERMATHIDVREAETPADCIELQLVTVNDRKVLGQFLNQQDLHVVRQALQQAGVVLCSNRWWETK